MPLSGIGIVLRESQSRTGLAQGRVPWLARFAAKLVLDILPGMLASVIGAFLFAQYQFGHPAPSPAVAQAAPASAEVMAMVRDEHAMMMDYLNRQIAAEQTSNSIANAASARALAEAQAAAEAKALPLPADNAAPHPMIAAAAKTARARTVAAAAIPHAPLVIAQVQQVSDEPAAPRNRLASDPNSLLAKTLDIKDQVVDATRHAVALIGNAFTSVGERIGEVLPAGRQFSSAS